MFSNPDQLNQFGCHINMAVFLELSVFGQGAFVPSLRMGDFSIVYVSNVVYVPFDLQRCNIFLNSSAGTSVRYKTFQVFTVLIVVTLVESW
jgi:hypothetical protein